ncbi:integrase family protein [Nitritalea halalkaliphila LW7]|uniref:Integrase family protein n=1 Tax=Nitritalea halalkaliphila LW7 TaxID=1189621 RepID=I5C6U4_9BACT|nr:integrase family protein [Nitritalea halalkaliphila]EIM77546.1 integrase family protein [Nitritalea halalkaliphila LW7]
MTFKKENYTTTVPKAKVVVPGFKQAFSQFEERMVLDQCSKSMASNYGRNIAHMALHFGKLPHEVPIDQVNSYLYRLTVYDNLSISFFKQTVFGLRYWYRLFGLNDQALHMPSIKHTQTLPTVLSKQECKDIFAAPRLLKHRFLLAFAYAAGLRMNELSLLTPCLLAKKKGNETKRTSKRKETKPNDHETPKKERKRT